MEQFYKYNDLVWYLYDKYTLKREHGTVRIDQWDDYLPKIGSAYATPCNSFGEPIKRAIKISTDKSTETTVDPIPGAKKYDDDKPMMDLLIDGCPGALMSVGEVLTYGYKKYGGKHGWKALPDARKRYEAAMLRHQLLLASGEVVDQESGLAHAAHIACNALFLLQFHTEGK